jgi:GNAT superfamily N-acetyltransferase
MPYKIREVDIDGTDEDVVETLDEIYALCFWKTAPPIEHNLMPRWWLAYHGAEAVAFGAMLPSVNSRKSGYLYRAGVLPKHRGHGLQRKLLRVREKAARRMGWTTLYTDTGGTVHSANNLIAAGYKIFVPRNPWGVSGAIYWKKQL